MNQTNANKDQLVRNHLGGVGAFRHSPFPVPHSLLLCVLFACAEPASPVVPTPCASVPVKQKLQKSTAVTIYNASGNKPGFATIKEKRKLFLNAGENQIEWGDIAATLDPTSVRLASKNHPENIQVKEQTFLYDLVNTEALLKRSLEKEITIIKEEKAFTGKLLSFDAEKITIEGEEGPQIFPMETARLLLTEPEEGLATSPTLRWLIDAKVAQEEELELSYLASGLSWSADYSLVLEGERADLSSWVTVRNSSGGYFDEAALKLMAGTVSATLQSYGEILGGALARGAATGEGKAAETRRTSHAGFTEKSFFEYHLYTLGRPVSLLGKSVKQIELFRPRTGAAKRSLIFDASQGYYYAEGRQAQGAQIEVKLKNDEASGLGIPLPQGRMRVYQQDPQDGSLELIGEDQVPHTPKGEEIKLNIGKAFDVVGEQKQLEYKYYDSGSDQKMEWRIRNRGKATEPIVIRITHYNAKLTDVSEKIEKVNDNLSEIKLSMAPGEEKVITYTIKYRW